jgi:hypothetical protein
VSAGDFKSRAEGTLCRERGLDSRAAVIRDLDRAIKRNSHALYNRMPGIFVPSEVRDGHRQISAALLHALYGRKGRKLVHEFDGPAADDEDDDDAAVAKVLAAVRGERRQATAAPPLPRAEPMPAPAPVEIERETDMATVAATVEAVCVETPADDETALIVAAERKLLAWLDSWGSSMQAAKVCGLSDQSLRNFRIGKKISAYSARLIVDAPWGPLSAEQVSDAGDRGALSPASRPAAGVATPAAEAAPPVPPQGEAAPLAGEAVAAALPPPQPEQDTPADAADAVAPLAASVPAGAGEAASPNAPPPPNDAGAGEPRDGGAAGGEEPAAPIDLRRAIAEVAKVGHSIKVLGGIDRIEPEPPPSPIRAALNDLHNRKCEAQSDWDAATQRALAARHQIDALQRAIDALESVAA